MSDLFTTVEGDLLAAQRGFIIHGCNDKGVMGSGVAAGVRARHPLAYALYRQAFDAGQLKIGTSTYYQAGLDLWVVNAVTQTLGGPEPLDLKGLEKCFFMTLNFMASYEMARGVPYGSIPLLFPMIGAGRAGGDWNVIKGLINRQLDSAADMFKTARPAVLYTVKVEPTDCR